MNGFLDTPISLQIGGMRKYQAVADFTKPIAVKHRNFTFRTAWHGIKGFFGQPVRVVGLVVKVA